MNDIDEMDASESRKQGYQSIDEDWIETTQVELKQLFRDGKITPDTKVAWVDGPIFDYRDIEAEFFYRYQGMYLPADNEDELYRLASESKIKPSTTIWGKNLPTKGIAYSLSSHPTV